MNGLHFYLLSSFKGIDLMVRVDPSVCRFRQNCQDIKLADVEGGETRFLTLGTINFHHYAEDRGWFVTEEILSLASKWFEENEIAAMREIRQAQEKEPLIPCNLCEEPCGVLGGKNDPGDRRMGLFTSVSGGYWSTPGNGDGALDDGSSYRFAICEFCLDWLFTFFRIPPKESFYLPSGGDPGPFRSAEKRVQEDDWRRMKDKFFVEAARRAAKRRVP